jgi:hypothetical protein
LGADVDVDAAGAGADVFVSLIISHFSLVKLCVCVVVLVPTLSKAESSLSDSMASDYKQQKRDDRRVSDTDSCAPQPETRDPLMMTESKRSTRFRWSTIKVWEMTWNEESLVDYTESEQSNRIGISYRESGTAFKPTVLCYTLDLSHKCSITG